MRQGVCFEMSEKINSEEIKKMMKRITKTQKKIDKEILRVVTEAGNKND